ncbi:MAG: hypothetical protein WCO98_07730 [bacterium]
MLKYSILLMLLFGSLLAVLAAKPISSTKAPALKDAISTPQGTFALWYRSPATVTDMEMPNPDQALTINSFVYRVRDRKQRDILRYSRVYMTTSTKTPAQIAAFYRQVFGKNYGEATDVTKKETLICSGVDGNFRLVTIMDKDKYCRIKLERVRQYSVAPRVYTDREQKILSLLQDVAAKYRQTHRLQYNMTRIDSGSGVAKNLAPLQMKIDFIMPDKITVKGDRAGKPEVRIWTKPNGLLIQRDGAKDVLRSITGPLTTEDLPELEEDSVARMMLGENVINNSTDYIMIQDAPKTKKGPQSEVVLTFPEDKATMHVYINQLDKTINSTMTKYEGDDYNGVIKQFYNYNKIEQSIPAPDAKRAGIVIDAEPEAPLSASVNQNSISKVENK